MTKILSSATGKNGKLKLKQLSSVKVTACGQGWLASTSAKISVFRSIYRAEIHQVEESLSDPICGVAPGS
jgi:hypothetical protein